jgi:hypothetical protein
MWCTMNELRHKTMENNIVYKNVLDVRGIPGLIRQFATSSSDMSSYREIHKQTKGNRFIHCLWRLDRVLSRLIVPIFPVKTSGLDTKSTSDIVSVTELSRPVTRVTDLHRLTQARNTVETRGRGNCCSTHIVTSKWSPFVIKRYSMCT